MTESPEPSTRDWTLQRLRQMADRQIVQADAERKIHTAMAPDGGLSMAYCRDEGLEIIADFSANGFVLQANGNPVQVLLERAASGDQKATDELQAKFTPPQLDAITGVLEALTPSPDHDYDHDHAHSHVPRSYARDQPKVGRNEPCVCGSGKKFKKCCGAPA